MDKLQLWLGQDRIRGKPGRFIKRVIYAADQQIIPVLS